MYRNFLILLACTPALGGCDFMPSFEKTTPDMAQNAIESCGIATDGIAWEVTEEGAFAFGRKSPESAAPTSAQSECLLEWARQNRVQVQFIGWESGAA